MFYDGTDATGSTLFTFDPNSGPTGEVTIKGKLTVDGLIDPIGLLLTPQDQYNANSTGSTGLLWISSTGGLYYGESLLSKGPTGPTEQAPAPQSNFTLYLDYDSPNSISTLYIPPGLMTDPSLSGGAILTADVSGQVTFLGTSTVILENTSQPLVVKIDGSGYIAADYWVPIYGGNISQTKIYFKVGTDNSVEIRGLLLGNINGGNVTVKAATSRAAGYLATITLFYG
jgi:hypothetical protein